MVSLRFAALGLLAQHPGSGYDLLKRFEKSMANVWPATQSQLYSELNRLADSGLIEVTAVGPRGRKEYWVTSAGRAELRRWITDSSDDPPLRRPDLLRVFLLGELPRPPPAGTPPHSPNTPGPNSTASRRCAIRCAGTTTTPRSTGAQRWSTGSGSPPWRPSGRPG